MMAPSGTLLAMWTASTWYIFAMWTASTWYIFAPFAYFSPTSKILQGHVEPSEI
jgi:hypothetical protein